MRFNARQAFNAVLLHTHRHHLSEGFEIDQTDIATTTIRLIAIPEFTALCVLAGRSKLLTKTPAYNQPRWNKTRKDLRLEALRKSQR